MGDGILVAGGWVVMPAILAGDPSPLAEGHSAQVASLPSTTAKLPRLNSAGVSALYVTPAPVTRESTRVNPDAGASWVNSRLPAPTVTGKTSSRYSSTRPAACRVRARPQLPCTCSSPPGRCFSSRTCCTGSPSSTVVCFHCGSVRVCETTYLGSSLSPVAIELSGSVTADQYGNIRS